MRPTCPDGCELLQTYCYCGCPENTLPANEDRTRCVPTQTCSSYAPGDLIADNTFDLLCNKVGTPKDTECDPNFTEWQAGLCFINCPVGLLENGLTCLKRSIPRPFQSPDCANVLMWYDGSSCAYNPLSIFILLAIIGLGIGWLISYTNNGKCNQRPVVSKKIR